MAHWPSLDQTPEERTAMELLKPGILVGYVERALRERPGAGRSGWSSRPHLKRDAERLVGRPIPKKPFEAALALLVRRGAARAWSTPDGMAWYCPTDMPGTHVMPTHLLKPLADSARSPVPPAPPR
jgi:hypothetical protein